ncbi:hypothetical protein A3Q56_02926 [Intoshia linei]|uniref:FAD dependent oxidoreductase domain-containing protein n=1 Tax=Intoshia linei TaxID=1819745 RepID=A0A177B4Z8_9BILA|nr:hypothetical protein A3Q56_02926 [Intoshia linei]
MIKRFPFHHLSLRRQSIQNHKNFDVVICGGGLIGSSIAYNLSYLGYNNVLIINTHSVDKVRLWKSSGIVSHLHSNALERSLVKDSTQFYKKLHNDGIDIGSTINVKSHILTPSILKKEADYLNTTDLKGALMIEEDCLIESFKLKKYYYTKFMEKNVTLVENTNVVKIIQQPDKTFTLFTNTGSYNSKALVNCAGLNARNIGMSSQPKVYIPSYPCSHHTLISKYNFESDRMPIIRDFDGGIHIQFRPKDSYIKMGGYELFGEPILPEKGNNVNMYNLKPEWNKFNSMLHEFLFRIPFLSNQKADHLTNYAESFSPDGKFVFGESLEVPKYYVIAGLCARGLQSSYDLGHQMAHLIVNGFTPKCMDFFDVKRFIKLHNNKNYLIKRISEATSLSTTIMYWNTESSHLITCRNIRSSVISPRLVDYAVFGQTNAYERPLYFKIQPADNEKDEIDIITNNQKNMNEEVSLFKKPIWFKNVEREYWACRKNAGILDMSSYSKAEISSENEEALNLLQYICSNDVDKPVGSVVHTGMLNEFGGYENDCSIVRLGKYRFLMISPTIQQRRSYYWIKRHIKPNSLVKDVDLTSMYTVLNIVGPHSQELLQSITETSLDVVNFPTVSTNIEKPII